MINETFDPNDTPSKKRKRENNSRFVSSTPIKLANKENFLFTDSLCMEHKSIADLVAERNATKLQKTNDFEVIRKPPKKKKKNSEDCCFVNSGLDLQVDEKPINPFEVVRSDKYEALKLAQGVINPALDVAETVIKTPKVSTNPFEVTREYEPEKSVGIENSALELNPPGHKPLMIQLPFTPTINHRIDFSNMPENLTPSALLSSKLVIENKDDAGVVGTPKRNSTVKTRKSLSVISEEVEIDIGEELDNYQLQLENSINEAKMQNRKYVFDTPKTIFEEPESEAPQDVVANDATYTKETTVTIEVSTKTFEVSTTNVQVEAEISGLKETNVDDEKNLDDGDVQFEEVDSFDDNFGKLGQFKRAYRVDPPPTFKHPSAIPPVDSQPKKSNLSGSIRRSIRKLISHKTDKTSEASDTEKHEGLFQTLRHSLRRKPKPKTDPVSLETTVIGRSVFKEEIKEDGPKKTLERHTLKRHVVKTVKSFMENVEEFNHY